MNGVLVLHSPDHWCNHHGMTSGLNSTQLQSWKECYLLKKDDGSFDGCQIKVPTAGNADDFWSSKDPFQACFDSNHLKVFFKQLPCLGLAPFKGFLSRHSALQGRKPQRVRCSELQKDTISYHVKKTDADFGFVKTQYSFLNVGRARAYMAPSDPLD